MVDLTQKIGTFLCFLRPNYPRSSAYVEKGAFCLQHNAICAYSGRSNRACGVCSKKGNNGTRV